MWRIFSIIRHGVFGWFSMNGLDNLYTASPIICTLYTVACRRIGSDTNCFFVMLVVYSSTRLIACSICSNRLLWQVAFEHLECFLCWTTRHIHCISQGYVRVHAPLAWRTSLSLFHKIGLSRALFLVLVIEFLYSPSYKDALSCGDKGKKKIWNRQI